MLKNEEMLVKRSQNGDLEAFEELIAPYQQKIYNLAYRLLGNYHDASDAAQEVMLKLYRSLGGFRGEAAFSTWLYRVTINACNDYLLKLSRRKENSLDELIQTDKGELAKDIPDYGAIPENNYLDQELAQFLQGLIMSLPEEYRIVMVLREIEGLSYLEIQDYLSISLGTVKSRINRARRLLRKKILQNTEQYPEFLRLMDIREVK